MNLLVPERDPNLKTRHVVVWYAVVRHSWRFSRNVMFWKKNGYQNPVNGGYICTASSQIQGARMISIQDSICALALAGCWEAG